MEGYGRKELKQVKKGQNWQKSMKQTDFGQFGQPGQSTISGRSSAPRRSFGKPKSVPFFGSAEMGKLGRFIFRLSWLYKDN